MFFACVVCKTTHCLLRLLGFGATALPGVLALKICPDILEYAAKNVKIVAVTGTNGKTTSCRMIERALTETGAEVCANRSGANLMGGVAAALIMNMRLSLGVKCAFAVLECDEAACRRVLGKIKPEVLVVTNLFRDQLDRYGSVERPRDCIAKGLSQSPDTIAVVNADCPMAASIAGMIRNKTVWFGSDCGKSSGIGSGEDDRCPKCGGRLSYGSVSYANLGNFSCACGFARKKPDYCISALLPEGGMVLKTPSGSAVCKLGLPGVYNAYNAAGCIAAAVSMGCDAEAAVHAVGDFDCGCGRMEDFPLGKRGARMILIKNAAAADQTLEQVRSFNGSKSVVLAINDRTADGTDISWLDDADFGKLARTKELKNVYVCGDRAETAAKRLERENICCKSFKNYDKLIKELKNEDAFIFVLPTYTAMMLLRKQLTDELGGKKFWQ